MKKLRDSRVKVRREDTGKYKFVFAGKDGVKIKGRVELPPRPEGEAALQPAQEARVLRRYLDALAEGLHDAVGEIKGPGKGGKREAGAIRSGVAKPETETGGNGEKD